MESIIIFSGSSLICFLLLALFSRSINGSLPQNRVLRSLGRTTPVKETSNDDKAANKQIARMSLHRFINILAKKKNKDQNDNAELAAAGLKDWTSAEWKVLRYSAGFCCALAAAAIITLQKLSMLASIELMSAGFILGFLGPSFWLKSKITKRNEEIARTLPDILDLIMVSVEAGLGFDAAIMKVVEKQKGVLAEEFNVVLQEIKMGKPRRDSLRDMAKKNNIEDLSNAIAAIVQADQLGISIGSVLRNQSNQIRQKRKQRAQEQAQKAPVKIMIPLVFFIFPSLFIIILGPAFIQIMNFFSK